MKLSPLKKKKNKAVNLNKVEKLLKGTRLRVVFLKGQYYLGTVICSVVRKKPWFKLLFDDGQKLSFPYPVSRQIKIISESDLSVNSSTSFKSVFKSDDSFEFTETEYSQAKIRIGKKYQATIPEYLGHYTSK